MLQTEVVMKAENPESGQYIHQMKKILGAARPKTQIAFKNQEFVEGSAQAKGKKVEVLKVDKFVS